MLQGIKIPKLPLVGSDTVRTVHAVLVEVL